MDRRRSVLKVCGICVDSSRYNRVLERMRELAVAASAKEFGLDRLRVSEKITLIDELWADVVAHTDEAPVSAELAVELDRRVASYKANPADIYTVDEVVAEIKKEHSG